MTRAWHPRPAALAAGLALATLALFWPALRCGFVNYDDNLYVYENPHARAGLAPASIRWAFTAQLVEHSPHADNWIPLSYLSHLAAVALFGLDPMGHHLVNIVLHAANACLLFAFLLAATKSPLRSAAAAALFAWHPLRVESVVWISERKDVLSGVFWWSSLWAYVRFARRPSAARYAGAALLYALSLLAKPVGVSLPLVLLLLDAWPLRRWPALAALRSGNERAARAAGRLLLEKLPFIAMAGAVSLLTLRVHQNPLHAWEGLTLTWRIANALCAYAGYIEAFVWPSGLAVFYPHPGSSLPPARLACSVLLLAALSAAVWRWGRRRPYLAFGWLWYLGTMLPMAGLAQVGNQAMADRYTYIPQAGLGVAVVWLLADELLRRRASGRAAAVAAALPLLALTAATRAQIRHWTDSVALWRRALAVTERNAVACLSLGIALLERGKDAEALGFLEDAVRLHPGNPSGHNNLGVALERNGQLDRAIGHFRSAIAIYKNDAQAYNNLGAALAKQGRFSEAAGHYRTAIRLRPDQPSAYFNLGFALSRLGRLEEAAAALRTFTRIRPDDRDAHYLLGNALLRGGLPAEAAGEFRRALELDPGYAPARKELDAALSGLGRGT